MRRAVSLSAVTDEEDAALAAVGALLAAIGASAVVLGIGGLAATGLSAAVALSGLLVLAASRRLTRGDVASLRVGVAACWVCIGLGTLAALLTDVDGVALALIVLLFGGATLYLRQLLDERSAGAQLPPPEVDRGSIEDLP
ncbi:MAG: hypothetical protein DLM71_08355 [Chloroflexi bacterium]|nr:MAG: hypothetical protein DLM71_08355 [Chloroflexota bacterium]